MTTITTGFDIRLGVKDAETVRRALQQIGGDGEAALKRLDAAARQAGSRGLRVVDATVQELGGHAQALAGRIGPVGSMLGSLGPAGLAAAAGLGAVTIGLSAAIREFAAAERIGLRLDAVLKATGHTAGLTRAQIDELADSLARSTIFDDDQIKEAAATLATFRNVSGDTFKTAIGLATDLAAVYGGDLNSAIVQIGKALEAPEKGVTALARSGVTFSAAQREMIETLVESGRLLEAQGLIAAEVQKQLGGAAAGEASGLFGALEGVRKKWSDFLEEVGRTPAVVEAAKSALSAVGELLDFGTDVVKGPSLQEQRDHLAETGRRLDVDAGDPSSGPFFRFSKTLTDQERAAELARLDELIEREERRRTAAEMAAQAAAAEHSARTAAEAEAAAAAERHAEIEKERAGILSEARIELQKQVDAEAEARAAVEAMAASYDAEREALHLTERQLFMLNARREAERKLIQEGIDDRDTLLQKVVQSAAAYFDEREAIEAANKARDEAIREQERQAQAQAEALRRPFENAFDSIQGSAREFFRDLLSGGVDGFKDLAHQGKRILTDFFAEMATLFVLRPLVTPAVDLPADRRLTAEQILAGLEAAD